MHFLIWETLSFNLMYVAACYPVGTTISKTSSLYTALLQHYIYAFIKKVDRGAREQRISPFFSEQYIKLVLIVETE